MDVSRSCTINVHDLLRITQNDLFYFRHTVPYLSFDSGCPFSFHTKWPLEIKADIWTKNIGPTYWHGLLYPIFFSNKNRSTFLTLLKHSKCAFEISSVDRHVGAHKATRTNMRFQPITWRWCWPLIFGNFSSPTYWSLKQTGPICWSTCLVKLTKADEEKDKCFLQKVNLRNSLKSLITKILPKDWQKSVFLDVVEFSITRPKNKTSNRENQLRLQINKNPKFIKLSLIRRLN